MIETYELNPDSKLRRACRIIDMLICKFWFCLFYYKRSLVLPARSFLNNWFDVVIRAMCMSQSLATEDISCSAYIDMVTGIGM
jgi:hypothetical protein